MPLQTSSTIGSFVWDDSAFRASAIADAKRALALTVIAAIADAVDRSPIETGSFQGSIHAASPGFMLIEDEKYNSRVGGNQTAATPSVEELILMIEVSADGDLHLWFGSWLSYSYYVERGFHTVDRSYTRTDREGNEERVQVGGTFISGYRVIQGAGDGAMIEFPRYFAMAQQQRKDEEFRARYRVVKT
jgi:hypothetical protein